MTRTLYIETVGCQMNVLDSEMVVADLRKRGYELARDLAAADVILFNTCSVREQAENKTYSALGRLRLAAMALLLLPMYPAMFWATIVIARHVRLDFTPGLGVVGVEAAIYLAAWASIARLITPRRRDTATAVAQAPPPGAEKPSQE